MTVYMRVRACTRPFVCVCVCVCLRAFVYVFCVSMYIYMYVCVCEHSRTCGLVSNVTSTIRYKAVVILQVNVCFLYYVGIN